jgi:hypothetical protein
MGADACHDIAEIRHFLAEVFLFLTRERGRIVLEHKLKRRERGDALGLDQHLGFFQKTRVLEHCEVAAEDGCLVWPDLLRDFHDNGLELGDGMLYRQVEALDFGRYRFRAWQGLWIPSPQDRFDPVRDSDHDPGTYRDSFMHHALSLASRPAQNNACRCRAGVRSMCSNGGRC